MKVVSWIKRQRAKAGTGSETASAPPPAESLDLDKEAEQRRASIPKRRRIGLRGILIGTMGLITVGLVRIWSESKGSASSALIRRYEAVYHQLPWGKLYL